MPKVVVTDLKGLVQSTGAGVEIKGAEDGTTPAYIALADATGQLHYLFVDVNGALNISTSAPTSSAEVAVVGDQSPA